MIYQKILIFTASIILILLVVTITKTNSLNLDVGNAHIFSGPKNSYFGYSVAFVKNGKDEKWILIGAPRANDSITPLLSEPGILYRCRKDQPFECTPVPINSGTGSTSNNWMGVSLDVGLQLILVCGHRWISQNNNMNGLCVELGRDFDQIRSRQYLTDPNMQTVDDKLVYGIGAMGMSCAYAPTGQSSVIEKAIGAPGIYEASGGVVKHTTFDQTTDVINFPTLSQTQGQLYGYTVTYGKLYGGNAYNMITGGPRDSMTGQVKILQDKTNNLEQQLPGEQVGSYFGAALATTPLQTGEPEYLLVGAPMYAGYDRINWDTIAEIGKVYIYKYDSGAGKMVQTQALNGSQSQRSRFGTAIAGLNDINGDTYYDIAVGAPYEDEGRGVVYIYNGYKGGFWPLETQRIKGRDISSDLMTFGAAISKPFLYNNDTYYDTLIGAFMSDKAVLVYSQPTINMQVTMAIGGPITNDIVKEGTERFTVEVCFSYQGKDLPKTAVVEFTVDVDTNSNGKRRRVILETGGYNVSGSKIVQKALEETCVLPPYTVIVQSHSDLFVPLVFSTTYQIRNDTVSTCKNNVCPTVNTFNGARSNPTITGFDKELMLERPGCGEDNVCQVDVTVQSKIKFKNPDTDLIVGEKAVFELDVQMINNGQDWAYSPYTEIEVPRYIDFIMSEPPDVACYQKSSTMLVCQIPELLKAQEVKYFNVKFDASKAPVQDFVITVNGETISSDTNPANNQQEIPVSVRSKVNEEFRGVSFPEIYVTKEETDMKLVTHKFDFENNGPSDLSSETEFVAKFPFLRLNNQDLFVLQQYIVVNVSSARNTSVRCWVNRGNSMEYMAATTEDGEGVVSHRFNVQESFSFEGNAQNKDCQTDDCQSFTCGVNPIPAGFAVSITMNFTLNPNTLATVQASENDVLKEVKISSVVTINYPDNLALIEEDMESTQTATTTVLPNKPLEESVPAWVIILSILGACVLIAIIILTCWKVGFFKRKQIPTEERNKLIMVETGTTSKPAEAAEAADAADAAEADGEPVDKKELTEEETLNGDVGNENEKQDETEKLVGNSSPDDITEDSNKV
ncbi:integrin alpha-9-like isoform X2 [Pecten maximus]|uniref:integrin alpha-9-like isoform X2 n=1 Tax=Pecten maximus TaxID=6579 RepID=UPI001458D04E|nr:integrin alpha-9-like isoform X2 [Pecten maximus]